MYVDYDSKKIKQLLTDFFYATGININLLRADFSPVCESVCNSGFCRCVQKNPQGKKACRESDRALLEKCRDTLSASMHICHAGLVDMAVPIVQGDSAIGYIILGQLRQKDLSHFLPDISDKYQLDCEMMKNLYNRLPCIEAEKINSTVNIASVLAKYVLTENMMTLKINKNTEKAVEYIRNNLDKPLSVKEISKNVNVSKSTLYKNFRDSFNCTLSEYINSLRTDKSVYFLENTDMSIEEISAVSGFSSASYYSEVFRGIKGISPSKYRKNLKSEK